MRAHGQRWFASSVDSILLPSVDGNAEFAFGVQKAVFDRPYRNAILNFTGRTQTVERAVSHAQLKDEHSRLGGDLGGLRPLSVQARREEPFSHAYEQSAGVSPSLKNMNKPG